MAGDPGMAYLNNLLDCFWLMDLGSAASGAAQDRYEASVIKEARAIVAGESKRAPTTEHLRIALSQLDGAKPAPLDDGESPF